VIEHAAQLGKDAVAAVRAERSSAALQAVAVLEEIEFAGRHRSWRDGAKSAARWLVEIGITCASAPAVPGGAAESVLDEVLATFSRLDNMIRGQALADAVISASSYGAGRPHPDAFIRRLRAAGFAEPDRLDFMAARGHW
jgi:hypothetical protein